MFILYLLKIIFSENLFELLRCKSLLGHCFLLPVSVEIVGDFGILMRRVGAITVTA
jgi:hypothetical protein